MSFNTGNPIGSISEEDCYDNMVNLDQAMNSTDPTWRDRFGVEKPTIDAALKSAGFMPAGFDFVTGGTLQPGDRNKAVYNPAPNGDNNWYRWNGAFPKEIAANSQPNPKDENNWVPVIIKTGVVEREALRRTYLEAGYNLVEGSFEQGGVLVNVNDVLLQERTGKAFSGPAGPVAAGTNPASGGFIDQSQSLTVSEKIKTKYGTLNVFTDKMVYAPAVGILPTNTSAQNTGALEAIRAIGGLSLYIPAGTFPFDVFRTEGLVEICGAGKDVTIVTLTAVGSAASVQFNKSTVRGIHFKSIAGSLEWQRTAYKTNVELFDCKISGYAHNSSAPNSWGAYFKDAKDCKLTRVEFDGNSQSDIALLEGSENIVIDGCFHTSGELHINFEPNNNTTRMRGIELRNMVINKLNFLNNDLNSPAEDVASVTGCYISNLYYDGLGVTFINTSILNVSPAVDGNRRSYGADLRGVRVDTRELVPDPIFSKVSTNPDPSGWNTGYVTLPFVDRYNRNAEGALVLNPNTKTGLVWLYSSKFPVDADTSYLISLHREIIVWGTRPDISFVRFYDANKVEIPNTSNNIVHSYPNSSGKKLFRAVFKTPPNAAFAELVMYNDDSSNHQQTVAYYFVSVRKILTNGNGVDCSTINYENNLRRVRLPLTKAEFDAAQYYYCPLPVGTEIEFAYAPGADVTRLAVVTEQAADSKGRFGTLRVIAKYP